MAGGDTQNGGGGGHSKWRGDTQTIERDDTNLRVEDWRLGVGTQNGGGGMEGPPQSGGVSLYAPHPNFFCPPPQFSLPPPPSRNQLRSLPPSLCRLQLHVLLLSHNRLQRLPEAIGGMAALRQLVGDPSPPMGDPPQNGRPPPK